MYEWTILHIDGFSRNLINVLLWISEFTILVHNISHYLLIKKTSKFKNKTTFFFQILLQMLNVFLQWNTKLQTEEVYFESSEIYVTTLSFY